MGGVEQGRELRREMYSGTEMRWHALGLCLLARTSADHFNLFSYVRREFTIMTYAMAISQALAKRAANKVTRRRTGILSKRASSRSPLPPAPAALVICKPVLPR